MCHAGIDTVGTLRYAGKELPHDRHVLSARVKCSQCHDMHPDRHETTLAAARDCASCHHAGAAAADCSSCHAAQHAVNSAASPRSTHAPGTVADGTAMTCASCHTVVGRPHARGSVVRACLACHDDKLDREKILDAWQAGIRAEYAELERQIARAEALLAERSKLSRRRAVALRAALARARGAAARVRRDGSDGAHNVVYVFQVLSDAATDLVTAIEDPTGGSRQRGGADAGAD
jgi:hypothetical protein